MKMIGSIKTLLRGASLMIAVAVRALTATGRPN